MAKTYQEKINTIIVTCCYCHKDVEKHTGHVNRAAKMGNKLYCSRECFGLDRRSKLTIEEKKLNKRLYDLEYMKKNKDLILEKIRLYNSSPAGRAMQKRNREKFKQSHLEYCRTTEYRKWKKQYDREFRAKNNYGEFWESFIHLQDIEEDIDNREVKLQLCLTNKNQKRKRNYERINSSKLERCPLGNS